MRRQDREITDPAAIQDIIRRCQVCHLAMCDGAHPYVVPLNFGYRDHRLYFHSAAEGRKIELLRANPRVSFVFDLDHRMVEAGVACRWGFCFRSVMGSGRAQVLEDETEKRAGLAAIMAHYDDREYTFSDAEVRRVAVIRVEIEELTGKEAVPT